jgi:nitrate/nitrite-specific signal transduction histidine kinase
MAAGTHAEVVDRVIHRFLGYKDLSVPSGDLQLAVAVVVLQQSREALLNVERHAQAQSVVVDVFELRDGVWSLYRD